MLPVRTLALVVVPWLGLASLACSGEGKVADTGPQDVGQPSPGKEAGAAGAAGGCDAAHGNAIEQEMLGWCELSERVVSDEVPLAPWKPASANKPSSGLIEMRPGSLQVGWRETAVGGLVGQLEEDREFAKMRGELGATRWSLMIGGDTPRAEVAAVFRTLADAGQPKGSLVLSVEPSDPVPQPRDPERLAALHTKLADADPSERAMLTAREIQAAMPPCPGLTHAFSAVATTSPDQRCALLARGISEGLVSCRCPKEDEMLTLVYSISMGSTPPERLTTVVPVVLDPAAAPRSGATWGEIVAGLDQGALQTLWVD
ncbi:MAG: hypothetical protein H6712_13285 [Myxococcales bacterium]|nr:hypothetical protein [Myxococcales bacterium]MCB9714834.1 hypothetical protein [Myxococcales bacterium]